MTNFKTLFTVSFVVNAIVTVYSRRHGSSKTCNSPHNSPQNDADSKSRHWSLLLRYLPVYFFGTLADWLQGPYVYALYQEAYGFDHHVIAILFVVGFGSSMILGGFVGGLADTFGRRRFVILYTLTYIVSSITKHFNSFFILLLGRITGGLATSLLFSSFDSWLIRAHSLANLDSFVSESFAAASYGNSIVAIFSGLLANFVVGASDESNNGGVVSIGKDSIIFRGGYINPFDCSIVACFICGILAASLWEENYGTGDGITRGFDTDCEDTKDKGAGAICPISSDRETKDMRSLGIRKTFGNAARTVFQSPKILICGLVSSFFESSMYIFVFMWTPGLKGTSDSVSEAVLPFGLIFSTFMVCCMLGTSLFSIVSKKNSIQKIGIYLLGVAAASMFTISFSVSRFATYVAMLLFEVCCGMYFPLMGTMKSKVVPESQRAAIYNIYRIPMNLIVVTSLLTNFSVKSSFLINACMLSLATLLQTRLCGILDTQTSCLTEDPQYEAVIDAVVEYVSDEDTKNAI